MDDIYCMSKLFHLFIYSYIHTYIHMYAQQLLNDDKVNVSAMFKSPL